GLRALDIENADDLVPTYQGNGKLRARTLHSLNVSRIFPDVVHDDSRALHRSGAGDAIAEFDPQVLHDFRRMAYREAEKKFLLLIIDEKDREDFVRNDPVGQLRNFLKQFIQ